MVQKTFFRVRSVAERRKLSRRRIYTAKNLVDRILEGDPVHEVNEIRADLLPGQFRQIGDPRVAARKHFKHGEYIPIPVPESWEAAVALPQSPLELITTRLDEKLHTAQPENIHALGFQWIPPWVRSRDNRRRYVPFVFLFEAGRYYAYMAQLGTILKGYAAAKRVSREGGVFAVTIPSKEEKDDQYVIKLEHVPFLEPRDRKAHVWFLGTSQGSHHPLHKFFNFGFKFESQTIPSDVQVFYPHEIAAYHLIVATEGRPSRANYIPLQTSPFPMPSQEGAEFYRRLLHNSVIFDPTITDQKNPEKLRALHINEVSRLLALYVARRGSAHAFWDLSRDGPIKDYDYSIPR